MLIYVVTESCTAMRDAYTLASRLHRDISIGNIILVREPGSTIRKGYLIDWDASCEVDASGVSVVPGRAVRYLLLVNTNVSNASIALAGYMAIHVQ